MQKRSVSLTLSTFILAILALTTPCFGADNSHFSSAGADGTMAQLELGAAPLITMQSVPFTLTVKDTNGAPLVGLDVVCDLTMPAMPMPKNQPKVTATTANYTGEVVFTMAGAWQATFTARDATGSELRLVFDIPEVLLK